MCECLDYDDGTRHTCEACAGDLEMLRDALTRSESARREASGCVCSDKARGYCHVHDTFLPTLPPPPARDEVREAAEEWAAAEAEYDAVPAYSRDTDAFGRNMFRRQSARRRLLAALSRDAKGGE